MNLSKEAKLDLIWWTNNLPSLRGSPSLPPIADLTISSDASKIGWAASWGTVRTGGPWNIHESQDHINILELKAAFFALKSFIKDQQQGDLSQNRQLDCSSISEQQGKYPLPSVTPLDTKDMEVVRDQTPLSSSSTCFRQEQCDCGRGISQNERPQRLEDRFDYHSASNQEVPNRSLCVSPDTSTEQIRQLAARSGCDPCGRVHNELDKFDNVRFSAIQPNSRRPSQDQEGNDNINIDCAPMVSSAMVC